MSAIELTAWLSAAYAMVLLLCAYGIDLLARRAHTANDEQQTQGFVFHEDHDAWLCPEDQWLWPQSFDPDNRVMRYRGKPSVCNACPVKDSCTSSDDGRELGRTVDSWPSSESARFHRGIACSVTVLAVALAGGLQLHGRAPEQPTAAAGHRCRHGDRRTAALVPPAPVPGRSRGSAVQVVGRELGGSCPRRRSPRPSSHQLCLRSTPHRGSCPAGPGTDPLRLRTKEHKRECLANCSSRSS